MVAGIMWGYKRLYGIIYRDITQSWRIKWKRTCKMTRKVRLERLKEDCTDPGALSMQMIPTVGRKVCK